MKLRAFVLGLLCSVMMLAGDVNGKWKAVAQGPEGQVEVTFQLKAEGSKLTGTANTPMGEIAISEGTVDGDKIQFTVATDQFKVLHKATLAGDEMKMTVELGDQSFEMVAKRVTN